MQIKAIFWDIGGVLFEDIEAPMMKEIAKKYNLDYEAVMQVRHKWWEKYATNKITVQEYWKGFLKDINIQEPIENFIQLPYLKYIVPKEEVIDLIKDITVPQYITSDHALDWFNFSKQKSDFMDNFEKVFVSFDLGMLKCREFFEIALRRTGYKPEEVLVIDNSKKIIKLVESMGFRTYLFVSIENIKIFLLNKNLYNL